MQSSFAWVTLESLPSDFHFKLSQNQIGTNKFHWVLPDNDKCKYRINRGNTHIAKYFQGYDVHDDIFFFLLYHDLHVARKVLNFSPVWSVFCAMSWRLNTFSLQLLVQQQYREIDTQVLNVNYMSNSILCLHLSLTSFVSC